MTTNLESGQTAGNVGNANANVSGGEGDEQTSRLEARLEELAGKLTELDKSYRTLQSGKDKAVTNVQKEVSSIREALDKLGALEGQGLSKDEAIYRLELEEELANLRNQVSSLGNAPVGNSAPKQPGYSKVIEALGLDGNDPAIVALSAEGLSDAEFAVKVASLAVQRSQSPSPTPATLPASTGAHAPSQYTMQDYQRERQAIVDKQYSHDERLRLITNLQIAAREKGLNV